MKNLLSRITVFALVISMILMAASCGTAKDPTADYREIEIAQIEAVEQEIGKAMELSYPSSASANVKLTVSDELVNALGIATYLGSLRSVSLNVDYATVEDLTGGKMDILLGDTEIASAGIVAEGSSKLYITLPGYSDKALALTLPETEVNLNMYQDIIGLYTDPELYACIRELVTVALEQITDVEKIKTTLTVGDITQDCDAYTYAIDEAKAIEVSTVIVNELKTNQRIRDYVKSTADKIIKLTGEELDVDVLAEMDKMLDQAVAELNKETAENETETADIVTFKLYTDSKNNVIGREITIADEGRLFVGAVQNGQDIAAEASVIFGEDSVSLKVDGTLVNNKFSGNCGVYADIADLREISASNELFSITLEDYYYSLDEAVVSGKLTMEYGQIFKDMLTAATQEDPQAAAIIAAIANLKLVYDFNVNADTTSIIIKIFAGEMEIGTISETLTPKTDYVPTIPAADIVLTEEQAAEFGSSINIMKILGNVQSCLPAETLALLLGSAG